MAIKLRFISHSHVFWGFIVEFCILLANLWGICVEPHKQICLVLPRVLFLPSRCRGQRSGIKYEACKSRTNHNMWPGIASIPMQRQWNWSAWHAKESPRTVLANGPLKCCMQHTTGCNAIYRQRDLTSDLRLCCSFIEHQGLRWSPFQGTRITGIEIMHRIDYRSP